MHFERKTYYKDEDIHVYLEEIDEQVFLHVGIQNMSKSILKKIKEKWGEVVIRMYYAGYNEAYAYTKDNRIINLIGGADKIGEHKGYEVYRWALKQ